MDFAIPDEFRELWQRTEMFVRDEIILPENDKRLERTGRPRNFAAGWWRWGWRAGPTSPHVGREWGGLGLDYRGKVAAVFEVAGHSAAGADRDELLRA